MNNIEIWKDIPGYEGLYKVSSIGRVFGEKKKGLLNPFNNRGYLRVTLFKNGVGKHYSIHRLVAVTFIPNPMQLPQINHINENKSDNRVENLEWCDIDYNVNYGTCRERAMKKHRKPVLQFTLDGKFVKEWNAARTAEKTFSNTFGRICAVCKGYKKSAYGYKWEYKK